MGLLRKIFPLCAAGVILALAVFLWHKSEIRIAKRESYAQASIDCKMAAVEATKRTIKKQVDAREKFNPADRIKLIDYLAKHDGLRSDK